ncbi:transglutaminase-like putative cysteine protease [Anseongella ginsenosidimutans]|uniref:Transglutaminase-like putative cysteine protease n=1 Tax=Anseongella ginsenosidimutans TaxID=496056 RepID=A0A4V2UTV8_9SPHI|nr:DUF3857 domain-containing protein [Anseongella ginsenosidimutans]TCS87888.1 transglutaminase-like putative cysteine protease [Anseongella ginsenosidimutans]
MPELLRIFLFIPFLFITSLAAFPQVPGLAAGDRPGWVTDILLKTEKPPLESITEGYFIALLEQQLHAGKQAAYTRVIREIVTGAGVQNGSEIYISFLPDYQQLTVHEVIVWRDNKPQQRLDIDAFKVLAQESDLTRFIYNGAYTAYLLLEDIRQGDRIEYSYTVRGQNPVFGGRYYKDIYFQSSSDIAQVYSSLLVPQGREFAFRAFNDVPEVKITENDGTKRYVWEDSQVQAAEYEDYQPSWFDNYAHVQVSEYAGWEEVAKWGMEVNPVKSDYGGIFAGTVSELKATSESPADYQLAAIKLVQNDIRYMGVETGEHSHRANSPSEVLEQGYGDCKDKSLLLVALLKAGGVEAQLALVNTYYREKTGELLPSPMAFNHAVVRIGPEEGNAVWIDPTISFQGGGLRTRYFPSYGKALVLKKGASDLELIRANYEHGKIYCEETYFIPEGSDTVKLEVRTTYTHNHADDMRSMLAYSGQVETKKNYLDYYARLYPDIISIAPLDVADDEEENKLVISEYYEIKGFIEKDSLSNTGYIDFYANLINEQLPSIAASRKHPVSLNHPYDLDYKIRLITKERWKIPDDQFSIKRDAYFFHSYHSRVEDTTTLHYQFAFLKEFVPVEKARQLAADVEVLSDEQLGYRIPVYAEGYPSLAWNAILFSLVLAGLYAWLARAIYRRRTLSGEEAGEDQPQGRIGGWMILPLIGLILTPFSILGQLLSADYYSYELWQNMLNALPGQKWELISLMIFEMAGNLFVGCYAIFCVIAMLNRRDIFPKLVIGFYISNFVFLALDHGLVYLSSLPFSMEGSDVGDIAKALVGGAIWVSYFSVSTRVKDTFTVPYPRPNPLRMRLSP